MAAPRAALWHIRYHSRVEPIQDCHRCWVSQRKCQDKISYPSREVVDVAVREINEREEYREPVMRYPCRWGDHFHVAHATSDQALRRARKAERKWRRTSR
jgi:hypothetical protein